MRIRFLDSEDRQAAARRAGLEERIGALWRSISVVSEDSEKLVQVARRELAGIHPELGCELWTEDEGGTRRLALSVRGQPCLRPLARAVMNGAPELPGIALSGERPALKLGRALERARASAGLELRNTRVRAGFTRGHLLAIAIHDAAFRGADPEQARRASELVCEGVLGERVLDDWVESVAAVPLAGGGSLPVLNPGAEPAALAPISELANRVHAGIEGVLAGLPERPCHQRHREGEWTMFETQPERADDWPEQDDLLMATTSMPEMLKSFLQGSPFYSGRFSRHRERFCYLKLDAAGLDGRARLEQRSLLEDAFDRALVPEGLGCVVGNGFGVRYSYVDLALVDPENSLERVRRVARELGAPERSWFLFCDAELACEWLPVWPGAPAPPGLSEA